MNNLTQELMDFFEYSPYKTILTDSCHRLGLKINDEFPEILYQYDLKKLTSSGLTISELKKVIDKCSNSFSYFVMMKFREDPGDLDGELPPNEMPGEEDRAKVVEQLPVYRNFLIGYIVEFALIDQRPDNLVEYLKCVRVSHASSYGKLLRKWHSRALRLEA